MHHKHNLTITPFANSQYQIGVTVVEFAEHFGPWQLQKPLLGKIEEGLVRVISNSLNKKALKNSTALMSGMMSACCYHVASRLQACCQPVISMLPECYEQLTAC